jgi:hypothetical protein
VLQRSRAGPGSTHLNSNAGLFYSDRDEFIECAKVLLADQRMRDRMGRNGLNT